METVLERKASRTTAPVRDEFEPSLFHTASVKLGMWLFILSTFFYLL